MSKHAENEDFWKKLRLDGGKWIMNAMFQSVSKLGQLHPSASLKRHGVEVIKNIPYSTSGQKEHLLDIYRPIERPEPLPTIVYMHGGAFQILSKETHWLMGLMLARRGYVVLNINYRLAPQHRYPKGLQDAMTAILWAQKNVHQYDGNPHRMILSGESAGANFATALTLAAHYEETEEWAKPLWDANVPVECVLPICGILQVSDAERFVRRKKKLSSFVADRITNVPRAYLPIEKNRPKENAQIKVTLLDPLLFLERSLPPDRLLPPFFTAVGTKDPLLDDTRRLKAALDCLNVPCDVRYYEGEVHAFHAFAWRKQAQECWQAQYAFLDLHAPTPYEIKAKY